MVRKTHVGGGISNDRSSDRKPKNILGRPNRPLEAREQDLCQITATMWNI